MIRPEKRSDCQAVHVAVHVLVVEIDAVGHVGEGRVPVPSGGSEVDLFPQGVLDDGEVAAGDVVRFQSLVPAVFKVGVESMTLVGRGVGERILQEPPVHGVLFENALGEAGDLGGQR